MTTVEFVFFLVELAGTVAFAISGAVSAIRRELDLFGVLFLGGVTAIGGGVIRDVLLGQIPPRAFLDYIYLATAAVTALSVFFMTAWKQRHGGYGWKHADAFLNFFDAAGLGIFSVVGVQNTIQAGFEDNGFFCIFLGMTTGIGGGILRDMMSRRTPVVFRKHIYALASLGGSVCYYLLYGIMPIGSMVIATLSVIIVRLLAARYCWQLPKIREEARK